VARTEGHAGALAGEDEDEGGDELSERRLEGARVVHLLGVAHGDVTDRHLAFLSPGLLLTAHSKQRLCCAQLTGMRRKAMRWW
jgi:hypothetical protein